MKRKQLLLMAALLTTMMLHAKDHTIVINAERETNTGRTTVSVHGEVSSDTLTVYPGRGVETITVSLKDLTGEVIETYKVSATWGDRLYIVSPNLPEGYLLEIKDERGTIYTQMED